MRRSRYTLLLISIVLITTACSKKNITPQFDMLIIDTLIGNGETACQVEYRFASIINAEKSPALQEIEKSNIAYFFELEAFEGTLHEAADSTIHQYTSELFPQEPAFHTPYDGEVSAESEASIVDTLLSYVITRSSYIGGAHGTYSIECHTYSLEGGYELSTVDLFSERQLLDMELLLRKKLREKYDVEDDKGLAEKGFFPEEISLTENFQITPTGITFYYNAYVIGCYALGTIEVMISQEELKRITSS